MILVRHLIKFHFHFIENETTSNFHFTFHFQVSKIRIRLSTIRAQHIAPTVMWIFSHEISHKKVIRGNIYYYRSHVSEDLLASNREAKTMSHEYLIYNYQ